MIIPPDVSGKPGQAPGALVALRSGTAASGNSRYFVTDVQGSVTVLVNSAGTAVANYQYDPYGRARTTTGPDAADNNWRYTGGYADNTTGLYKFGARFYDPSLGRFTQPDPSGRGTNAYLYAAADPINHIDPDGTFPFHLALEAAKDLLDAGLKFWDISDAAQFIQALIDGDTDEASDIAGSLIAGYGVTLVCGAVVAALAVASAGGLAVLGIVCAGLGEAAEAAFKAAADTEGE